MTRTIKRTIRYYDDIEDRWVLTDGYAVSADSPFTVHKDAEDRWTVGHQRTGLAINRIIPRALMRSKLRLLIWLEDMARDCPLEVAMLGLVESADMLWSDEFREYGQRLVDWSAGYECI